jgi:hypothetical protein
VKLFRRLGGRDLTVKQRKVSELFLETAKKLGDMTFDYSEQSVEQLESFVDRLWDPNAPPSEAELDSLTKLIGAYLGEVMIRNVGGHWAWSPDRNMPAIETDQGSWAYVLDKVYKRQVAGSEESLVEFYEAFKTRASN